MKSIPFTFLFLILLIFSCKKEENNSSSKNIDHTDTLETPNIPNNDSDSINNSVILKLSDSIGFVGDTLMLYSSEKNTSTPSITFTGNKSASPLAKTDTSFAFVIPDSKSGNITINWNGQIATFPFYKLEITCEALQKLTVSNFKITEVDVKEEIIRYTYDLTNNSDAYLKFFRYRPDNPNIYYEGLIVQDWVANTSGGIKDAAGGGVLSGASIYEPGKTYSMSGSSNGLDNYHIFDLYGTVNGSKCDVLEIETKVPMP